MENFFKFNLLYVVGLAGVMISLVCNLANAQNLICNPGFDGYPLIKGLIGQRYYYASSNSSCWYVEGGGNYEVKQITSPLVGNVAELVTNVKYTLCQDAATELNELYILAFDIMNSLQMNWSRIQIKVDNIIIYQISTNGSQTINHVIKNITANQVLTKICFIPNFQMNFGSFLINMGPCIDNVSLTKYILSPNQTLILPNTSVITPTTNQTSIISQNTTSNASTGVQNSTSNTTQDITQDLISNSTNYTPIPNATQLSMILVLVDCKTQFTQKFQQIVLKCKYNSTTAQWYLRKIVQSQGYQIYFQNQLQNQVISNVVDGQTIVFTIHPKRTYNLKKISVRLDEDVFTGILDNFQIKFFIDGSEIKFQILSGKQIQTLKIVKPILEGIMNKTKQVYLFLKATFVSYFLLDIISFWNLSLMYNFLNISTVPSFLKYVLEKMIHIFYQLSSMTNWLQQKIPALQDAFNFQKIAGREFMKEFLYGYVWFGSFGSSSGFVNNNFQSMLIFAILLLKVGLLILLRLTTKSFSKFTRKKFPKGVQLLKLFLNEVMGLQIFIIVSAATCLQNYGFQDFNQKFNNILQVLMMCFCLTLLPIYFIIDQMVIAKQLYKKQRKQRKISFMDKKLILTAFKLNLEKVSQRKRLKLSKFTAFNNILQYVPYITIPFLVALQNLNLFFYVNTLVIGLRCWSYIKFRSNLNYNVRQKAFIVLNLFVWAVLHTCYVVLWVFSKILADIDPQNIQQLNLKNKEFSQNIIILSFIIIFMVLAGGVLEVLNFLLQFLCYIIQILKQLHKRYNKNIQKQKESIDRAQKDNQQNGYRQKNLKNNKNRKLVFISNRGMKILKKNFQQCNRRTQKNLKQQEQVKNSSSNIEVEVLTSKSNQQPTDNKSTTIKILQNLKRANFKKAR